MRDKNQFLSNLLATTGFCVAVGLATPAAAQDNQQPQAGPVEGTTAEDDQAIVITGSRIPQPNLTATSPVAVVNSEEIRLQGTTRTEDLINSLPQAFAATSPTARPAPPRSTCAASAPTVPSC